MIDVKLTETDGLSDDSVQTEGLGDDSTQAESDDALISEAEQAEEPAAETEEAAPRRKRRREDGEDRDGEKKKSRNRDGEDRKGKKDGKKRKSKDTDGEEKKGKKDGKKKKNKDRDSESSDNEDVNSDNKKKGEKNKPKKERPSVKQIEKELERIKSRAEVIGGVANMVKNLLAIAAIAVLVTNLLIAVLVVSGPSMNPTMQDGEIVIALRVGLGSIEPGDLIAFYYNNKVLIKRVIAQSGDDVNIDENGVVTVNGIEFEEPEGVQRSLEQIDISLPYHIPGDGHLFVMGDNRSASSDSRLEAVGVVTPENILGRVWVRVWPLPSFGFFG